MMTETEEKDPDKLAIEESNTMDRNNYVLDMEKLKQLHKTTSKNLPQIDDGVKNVFKWLNKTYFDIRNITIWKPFYDLLKAEASYELCLYLSKDSPIHTTVAAKYMEYNLRQLRLVCSFITTGIIPKEWAAGNFSLYCERFFKKGTNTLNQFPPPDPLLGATPYKYKPYWMPILVEKGYLGSPNVINPACAPTPIFAVWLFAQNPYGFAWFLENCPIDYKTFANIILRNEVLDEITSYVITFGFRNMFATLQVLSPEQFCRLLSPITRLNLYFEYLEERKRMGTRACSVCEVELLLLLPEFREYILAKIISKNLYFMFNPKTHSRYALYLNSQLPRSDGDAKKCAIITEYYDLVNRQYGLRCVIDEVLEEKNPDQKLRMIYNILPRIILGELANLEKTPIYQHHFLKEFGYDPTANMIIFPKNGRATSMNLWKDFVYPSDYNQTAYKFDKSTNTFAKTGNGTSKASELKDIKYLPENMRDLYEYNPATQAVEINEEKWKLMREDEFLNKSVTKKRQAMERHSSKKKEENNCNLPEGVHLTMLKANLKTDICIERKRMKEADQMKINAERMEKRIAKKVNNKKNRNKKGKKGKSKGVMKADNEKVNKDVEEGIPSISADERTDTDPRSDEEQSNFVIEDEDDKTKVDPIKSGSRTNFLEIMNDIRSTHDNIDKIIEEMEQRETFLDMPKENEKDERM